MKKILLLFALIAAAIPAAAADEPETAERITIRYNALAIDLPLRHEVLALAPPQAPCSTLGTVCWDASPTPAASLVGYNVYRSRNSGDCPAPGQDLPGCVKLTLAPINALGFTDPAPQFGVSFYFVRAVASGNVESLNGTVITPLPAGSTATALQVLLRPAPPGNLRPAN